MKVNDCVMMPVVASGALDACEMIVGQETFKTRAEADARVAEVNAACFAALKAGKRANSAATPVVIW